MIRARLSLALGALALAGATTASAVTIDWGTTFGGPDADFAYDVIRTADDGFVAAGIGSDGNYESFLVVKTDAAGIVQWTREISLSDMPERAFSVLELDGGDLVVVGAAYLPGEAGFRPFLSRLESSGEVIWTTEDGLSQDIPATSGIVRAVQLAGGNLVLAGGSNSMTSPVDPWVAIVSPDGALISYDEYDPLIQGFGEGTYHESILAADDGGFLVSGYAGPGLGQAYLWKFDADGQSEWSRLYGPEGFRSANDVSPTADGGFIMTGCDLPNCYDTVVMRADAGGEPVWVTELPDTLRADGRSAIEMGNGSFLVSQRREIGYVAYATEILEIDADGSQVDRHPVEVGAVSNWVEQLRGLEDGAGFVGTGNVREELGVTKLDVLVIRGEYSGGRDEPLSVDAGLTPDVGGLRLAPNPTRGHLLLEAGGALIQRIEVYDVAGRRVLDERLDEAVPGVSVALDGVAPGTYFVRASHADGVTTARVAVHR